jgi:hypothetical protein
MSPLAMTTIISAAAMAWEREKETKGKLHCSFNITTFNTNVAQLVWIRFSEYYLKIVCA